MSTTRPHKRQHLLTLLILLTLGFAFWWSRRGPTELDHYKAQLIAQGEILDIDKLAPKRTGNEPDGDAPLHDAARQIFNGFHYRIDQFSPAVSTNNLLYVSWPNHLKATNQAQRAALWQQAETEVESRRSELTAASLILQNPPREKGGEYRNVSNYPKIDFVQRRGAVLFFSAALLADAHAGRSAQATTNMTALLDLCELHQEEWTFINQMIRIAITGVTINSFQYGLATRTWAEPELARLQGRFESLSLVTNTYQALLYMRAQGESTFATCRINAQLVSTNMFSGSLDIKDRLLAAYWATYSIEEDEQTFLKLSQERLDIYRQQIKSPSWAKVPDQMQTLSETTFGEVETDSLRHRLWLSSLLSPNLSIAFRSLITTETRRQQTITAIALERYHLKHGRLPDTLSKLIPDYLTQIPQDPMDGRPLRYRLNLDGTFTLWSVGFDGKDNGGDPTMPDPKKQSFPQDAQDLVWPKIDPVDLPTKP